MKSRYSQKSSKSQIIYIDFDLKKIILYHSLINNPILVEFENLKNKNEFIKALKYSSIKSGYKKLDNLLLITDEKARANLSKMEKKYLSNSDKRINYLSLLIAESCNLKCSYCITSENLKIAEINKKKLMTFSIAKKSIDWYLSLNPLTKKYYVNFSGGEPLLNKSVFVNSVKYIRLKKFSDRDIKITLNTNATLIDNELAQFIYDNEIEIATSLDGTPQMNDAVRITKNGQPTSNTILKGWEILRKNGNKISGFMVTINEKNIRKLDHKLIDFALEMSFKWVRVTFDIVHLTKFSVLKAIEKLWSVYEYGFKKDILIEGYWSTAANNILYKNRIPGSIGFYCGAVSGETISVHTDGRISTCGFSTNSFGNILNKSPFNFNRHRNLIHEYFPGIRSECFGCCIEGSCAGGCLISREISSNVLNNNIINFNCKVIIEMTKRLLVHHFKNKKNLKDEKLIKDFFN